jgi:hypothetical protein
VQDLQFRDSGFARIAISLNAVSSSQILQSHQVPTPPEFTAEMSVGLFFLEGCLYQTFMVTGKGLKKLYLSHLRTVKFLFNLFLFFYFFFFAWLANMCVLRKPFFQ